jgi:erythronate-4-phosphate dehydrogenase
VGAACKVSLSILADENIPAVEHYLGALGCVQRVSGRTLAPAQLQGVDVLLVRSVTRVDETLLAGSSVRFVGTATSGLDHIDRDYLTRQGIAFAYAPGSNANSVVEYVLSAIAAVGVTLEKLLTGGVVGIVGYGIIGKAVAARLKALGVHYRVYDPWLDQNTVSHAVSFDEILECDVVSLHPELTTEKPWPSHHLLGSVELKCLRPDALLINASRGPVLDNAALLSLLDRGVGPQTVLDVWEGEPDISSPLLQRVALGTAHIAGYSLDGKLLATRMLSEAVTARLQLPAPPRESPADDAPALVVSDTLSKAELVRYLLQSRYDISQDDALLRRAILGNREASGRGPGFDQLRKAYRERRELVGSVVYGALRVPGQVELIRALGCIPARSLPRQAGVR